MENFEFDLNSDDWGEANNNPMVRAFGLLKGQKCKQCKHLVKKEWAGTYYKCGFRANTNGPGSDHRVNWDACKRFEGVE